MQISPDLSAAGQRRQTLADPFAAQQGARTIV